MLPHRTHRCLLFVEMLIITVTMSTTSVHLFNTDGNILKTFGCTALKFCTDIYSPQSMNPTDFGDCLTFPHTG